MPLTPAGHGLGLIPDAHDDRDELLAVLDAAVPYHFVDLELDPATPPVWDQGQLGSCTAHGSLAAFLFASVKCGADDPMLSRLQLYYDTRKLEGSIDQDSGAQIRDAIKATGLGIAPEVDWPYDVARFTEAPPAEAVAAARDNVALSYKRVGVGTTSLQACLSDGFPVVIGMVLHQQFESSEALSSGVVPFPTRSEQVIGGHCMAAWGIGYGRDWKAAGQFPSAVDDVLYVKLRNSWGTGAYQRGYLLMEVRHLTRYGRDFWTIRRVS